MTDDWKTLRVPANDYAAAKEDKEANDRTWGEQLRHSESQDGPEVHIDVVEINGDSESMNEDDIRNIVESWIRDNYEDLKRGNL